MSYIERQNFNFLQKTVHERTGEEIDNGFLESVTYIESMDLTGPKLILLYRDRDDWLGHHIQFQEFDEISVSLADSWREDGANIAESFVTLSARNLRNGLIEVNAISKPLYKLKQIADKTKIFSMRGVSDILDTFANGLSVDLKSKFAVVENYHLIAGERPSTLLKQIAVEQGAEMWLSRGKIHVQKFKEAFAGSSSFKFEYNTTTAQYPVFDYDIPSGQLKLQEEKVRVFTGWNPEKGRVKTSTANPLLSGVKSLPTVINGNPNAYTLNTAVSAAKPAVRFTTVGSLGIEPGQVVEISWQEPDQENPINEGLPAKVVCQKVAHKYMGQKFYTRIEGGIPFESQQVLY